MRKFYLPIIIFLLVGGLYFYVAHWYIYFKMSQSNLIVPDTQRTYFMGQENTATKNILYVALGDSFTSGVGVTNYRDSLPSQLAQRMITDNTLVTLKDFSYPGYRTEDLINNFLPQTLALQPDIITLLIGINDVHGQVGEKVFKKNYQTIVEILTKNTKAKIYLISLPFVGSDTLLLPPYNLYFEQQTVNYNKIIKQLAIDYKLDYIDIFTPTVEQFKTNGTHYSPDLFHPSAEGYRLWAQIIYDVINH